MSINLGALAAYMVIFWFAKLMVVAVVGLFVLKGLVLGVKALKKLQQSQGQIPEADWDGFIYPVSGNG